MPPPTPTPFAATGLDKMPVLQFPSTWAFAPDAVQTWNLFGGATVVLQAIVLALIIGLGLWMLYKFFKGINNAAD